MASIDKILGRFLFGGNEAASLPNLAGAGSLTFLPGTVGATYYSNYVDLGQGSRFRMPFNSKSRNRTIILAGMLPYREWVYDTGDLTNKWPLTVARTGIMARGDYFASWAGGGYIGTSGANLIVSTPGGGTTPTWHTSEGVTYPMAYRNSTFNWQPSLIILGQGADGTGLYVGHTVGRNLAWSRNATAYTGNRGVIEPTIFGNVNITGTAGASTNVHCMLLGAAEYEWLTEPEALEAANEMVALLLARGWGNAFNYPQRTNIPLIGTGAGEGAMPPLASPPTITAVNANFTVAASPTNAGYTRITKVGGTNGTLEQAATSGLLPATWGVYIKDPAENALYSAGVSKQAGPYGESAIFGWHPNGAGSGSILRWAGAYAGSFRARVNGQALGVTRVCDGLNGSVCRFVDDKQTGYDTASGSYGTTDAAFPMIFDCTISGIGQYIDVLIA